LGGRGFMVGGWRWDAKGVGGGLGAAVPRPGEPHSKWATTILSDREGRGNYHGEQEHTTK